MVIDHVGLMFFPQVRWLRIIGRLALPIFAFMIAEGAKYTRNKCRYLLSLLTVGALCQIVYYVTERSLYLCILITFSLSVMMIYLLQNAKKVIFSDARVAVKVAHSAAFVVGVAAVYILNMYLEIDYGFHGCMLPVYASLFDFRGINVPHGIERLDNRYIRLVCFIPGMLVLCIGNPIQLYAFAALPLLLLYNGERGRFKMKYFFYVFYPLHLGIIGIIDMLIGYLK